MAFPSVQSATHQAYVENASPLVITKPTGLTEGELMIAIIGSSSDDGSGVGDVSAPSGWASIVNQTGGTSTRVLAFTKTANASDVAASNFTFTNSDTSESTTVGSIFRLESDSLTTTEFSNQISPSSTDVTFTSSQSTNHADALLFLAFLGKNLSGTNSYSSYFINGTNPTWTEERDTLLNAGRSHTIAIATAELSDVRTITSYGATAASAWASYTGLMLVVHKQKNATSDVSRLDASPTLHGVEGSNTAAADVSHIEIEPELHGVSGKSSSAGTQWVNESKPTTNWTNEQK